MRIKGRFTQLGGERKTKWGFASALNHASSLLASPQTTSKGFPAFLDFSGQIWIYTVDVSWRAAQIFIWGQLNPILNDQPRLSLFFLMSITSSVVSVAPGFSIYLFGWARPHFPQHQKAWKYFSQPIKKSCLQDNTHHSYTQFCCSSPSNFSSLWIVFLSCPLSKQIFEIVTLL